MSPSRRIAAVAVAALAALLGATGAAAAHPLGNFSVNHLTQVSVSSGRVDLRYVLDQAEIPTFQERGTSPGAVLARKRAEVLRGLALTVDGRRVALRPSRGATIEFPRGQGGLPVTRAVIPVGAPVRLPARIVLRDGTFPDRLGWKAIVARPGKGTAVRSDAPSGDPTDGLRTYPGDLLTSPVDERTATLTAREGSGTLVAPRAPDAAGTTTTSLSDHGLVQAFEKAAAGDGVLVLLLLAAFGWGAIHALSPGHGKAMVAAYLVGTRGTPRHAVALGLTVTVTHTAGVFALGLVTLLLSHHLLPEQIYPWLNLVSGLLVLAIGGAVLRSRVRWGRARRAAAHHHHHGHGHGHGLEHRHGHGLEHQHGHGLEHRHGHPHSHAPDDITGRGLIAAGTAAGLIPCPSALVVLLAAVAQHQIGLGLLLIVAFSLGLATTLTALGVAVVWSRSLAVHVDVSGRAVALLPAASAVAICAVGSMLTVRALEQLG